MPPAPLPPWRRYWLLIGASGLVLIVLMFWGLTEEGWEKMERLHQGEENGVEGMLGWGVVEAEEAPES